MRGIDGDIKRALVTGASSGLGKAIAEALMAQGVEVWGVGRNAERLEAMDGLHPVLADLTESMDWQAWYEKLDAEQGGFDLVVNNAGSAVLGRFEHLKAEDIEAQFRLLLSVPAALSQAALTAMRQRGRGYLVNMSSLAGDMPIPYMAPYNASKSALGTLSRSLMLEHPQGPPWIIDLRPGDFRTPFNQSIQRTESGEAWEASYFKQLDAHLEQAPSEVVLVHHLVKALQRSRHQSLACGSFFQSRIALFFGRCLAWRVFSRFIRRYYKLP